MAAHRIFPSVRRLLSLHSLDAGTIATTGPHGVLTKGDVLRMISLSDTAAPEKVSVPSPPPTPPPPPPTPSAPPAPSPSDSSASFVDIPVSPVRRVIASRLMQSKETTPHTYVSAEVDVDALMTMRGQLKEMGVAASVNDLVIKAVSLALRDAPRARGSWDAARGEAVEGAPEIDVAVAVATEGGLITPIVRGADLKPIQQLSSEFRDLATRARSGRLKPEEFQGGCFTISNLGMLGVTQFTAIINPPQSGILAVGGPQKKLCLLDNSKSPTTKTFMVVTLSCDERVWVGDTVQAFLEAFRGYIQNPATMLA